MSAYDRGLANSFMTAGRLAYAAVPTPSNRFDVLDPEEAALAAFLAGHGKFVGNTFSRLNTNRRFTCPANHYCLADLKGHA
jgi:hypothetical protein